MTERAAGGSVRPMADDSERGYTIEQTLDAPREVVWEAWTNPEPFAVWFGTDELEMRDVELDVRPGGEWHGTMVMPDGSERRWSGFFREVEAPEHLVMDLTDEDPPGEYERYTLTLRPAGDATAMTLRQSGGHLSDEEYERAKEGTTAFMQTLGGLLPGMLKARHDAD